MAQMPRSRKILVIEDNLINQKVIHLMLNRLGFATDVVENGTKGLDAIQKNDYRAVFVDLGLPDINGLEVIKRIRARTDEKAHWPVIVLTAGGTQHDRNYVLSNGANIYLYKPIVYEELREALAPWLSEIALAPVA